MKFVLSLACLGLAAAASPFQVNVAKPIDAKVMQAFENFVAKYNKDYDTAEYFKRLAIFAENLENIHQQNQEHVLAAGEAIFGITKFSDMSKEEFASTHLNFKIGESDIFMEREEVVLDGPLADSVDWRTKGVLTPVKDQAQCGSCWAFSATEAIESYAKLSGKYDLEVLSPQQIVSCDKVDSGCGGGWPYNAMTYAKNGMMTEADYPYTSQTGRVAACKFDKSKTVVSVTGYKGIAKGEQNLATALNNGPVSICVDASSWSAYTGGVMRTCGKNVDHAVQAVGYTADYWIVRNSWGENWGEDGFIRIARGNDLCLISDYVFYPTF